MVHSGRKGLRFSSLEKVFSKPDAPNVEDEGSDLPLDTQASSAPINEPADTASPSFRRTSLAILLTGFFVNVLLSMSFQFGRLQHENPVQIWPYMSQQMYVGLLTLQGKYPSASMDNYYYIARFLIPVLVESVARILFLTAVCITPVLIVIRRRIFTSRTPVVVVTCIVTLVLIFNFTISHF